MSEQTKPGEPQRQDATEEVPEVESVRLTDTDLENVSGGGVGASSSIQKGGTGYQGSKLS